MDFYRSCTDEATKKLLFKAARACRFCINDHCINLITDRTIYLDKRKKRVCGIHWYNRLELPVNHADLAQMGSVIEMAFRYCTPEMHEDLSVEKEVTYQVKTLPETYLVGFRHLSTMLSLRTGSFIRECFEQDGRGQMKLDALCELTGQTGNCQFTGVTRDFVDGLCYTYLLGVLCPKESLPEHLPEEVEVVRLGAGEYGLYASYNTEVRYVWEHFAEKFYEAYGLGYDITRLPSNVSIVKDV
jgi:hypothetical protein